ncbi:MAG: aminotransferase class I/II-fold pyridoxal phosphate-dependent enzyme [Proteobacteria bacterium]|nr:aminotransferase class I/II-fold pyridoxal phosphate-dependent enzyme [Pseudomonadota bacterium]MBS0573164.1 aminotransferase class I/II-fold pyridoxal phosphate-dependent enzyme [Pseudomonadota bacterium]
MTHSTAGLGTVLNHVGEHDDGRFSHTMPIYQTSTFGFLDGGDARAVLASNDSGRYVYTRGGNPNARQLARKIAWLEAADLIAMAPDADPDAVAGAEITASGLAAIVALSGALLAAGDTAIVQRSIYGGALGFWEAVAPRQGIRVVFVETADIADWEAAAAAHPEAKLFYVESPSTPLMHSYDIARIAQIAHANGARLAVDNTAATPCHQRPLTLGADYVIISTTKFMNGHGTQIGGAIVSRDSKETAVGGRIWTASSIQGGTPSPMDCWLTNNGLKTLELRMMRHSSNAMAMAEYLQRHPAVARVFYPGLASMPDHALAARQMSCGYSGLLSFELKGGEAAAFAFLRALKIPIIASSFGTTDTLVQHPYSMSHSYMSEEQKRAVGITEGLVRMSVGLETIEDLLNDVEGALTAVRGSKISVAG